MRRSSFRPRSTSHVSSVSFNLTQGRSTRESFSSRKFSQVHSDGPLSSHRESSLIDDGKLQGRIKVSTSIKNPDRCMSMNYRPNDGRFYAVGLANGTINVYSSKTDNILYVLNNEDKDLQYSDISTTCVRFRPCSQYNQTDDSLASNFLKGRQGRRKCSRAGSLSDPEPFLPPISATPRPSASFSRGRRKSSYSALGHSLDFNLLSTYSDETSLPNNLVSATFTDGSVKTFNFLTEHCVHEVKEKREILTMGYTNSGNMLATGGADGSILVYDVETGSIKCSYEPPFDYDRKLLRTYSIAFHPESESEFISGGWYKEIQFHDVRVANLLVSKVPGPKICGESLSFHPSGKEFCAAAWGKNEGLVIFDYAMRCPIESICGLSSKNGSAWDSPSKMAMQSRREHFPSSFLYSARYFMNNYIALCGAFPGSVVIIDRNAEKNIIASITDLPKGVFNIDTYKTRVAFTLGNEVCCTEIFI